jgi:hypothetical protein
MFAPRYTVWHCGYLKKGKREMSNTPRTDKLFFPYGRDATAAASPSLLVCMTQFEILERENAALRDVLSRLIEVHDAMGGMCSPERILAEEALKEEGK